MIVERMPANFYAQSTIELAKALIGNYLVHFLDGELLAGRITETEAYLGVLDRACHSYGRKQTKRTRILYEEPGHIYTYTMHTHCLLNVVTERRGQPEAVLIRGIEPVWGIEKMESLRGKSALDKQFANGPGKLTKALGITMEAYGESFIDGPLYIGYNDKKNVAPLLVKATRRIGIDNTGQAKYFPFRFIEDR
ncbi:MULTISPECIES: DNA-3-methyladenine glycosylase [Shouchella]|uniref:Putative 3-methyladenine DNA glycosylase n=2 Tax=Shouchella TaxID=2893057 RepID=A0ABY7W2Q4_9BACI|nr:MULTISPECIES: DNA-3-methyladenine glycosylase [Shouchella]MED4129881.1 DNA-3-methyladenine glycosylase [Shouchella miscanthi]WDF03230.1 DNA-3-methyladenine glycosylase [Shouchella hunanensis]GAF23021.1 DNA-3-methyladenine glycosylase II [Bacillus sp. JCM 19047]